MQHTKVIKRKDIDERNNALLRSELSLMKILIEKHLDKAKEFIKRVASDGKLDFQE